MARFSEFGKVISTKVADDRRGRAKGFGHVEMADEESARAAMEALKGFETWKELDSGIFPRRAMRVTVDRAKCVGCTLCVALAPQVMAMDEHGKAYPWTPEVEWLYSGVMNTNPSNRPMVAAHSWVCALRYWPMFGGSGSSRWGSG